VMVSGSRGRRVVAGGMTGNWDKVPVVPTGKMPMAWSKGVLRRHGSFMCWGCVWNQSKVSGVHKAAQSGVLLDVSCTMMEQLLWVE